MPQNDLIELACPKCGGTLELQQRSDDHYTCSYCGSAFQTKANNNPTLREIHQSVNEMQAALKDVQVTARAAADVRTLPLLVAQLNRVDQQIQRAGRALFSSLLIFGLGFFFSRVLIFTGSGWLRFMPRGLMLLGMVVFFLSLLGVLGRLRQRRMLEASLRGQRARR